MTDETNRTRNTEQLKAALANLERNLHENALAVCEILAELARRRESVPQMRMGFLRHYAKIASGALDVSAAIAMGGFEHGLSAVSRLPVEEQRRVARGGKITVARYNEVGRVTPVECTLLQLTQREIDMAVGDDGQRSFKAQKKILTARGPDVPPRPPRPRVRADVDTGEIVVGRFRIPVADLDAPLRRLGFRLVPVKQSEKMVA